MSDQTVTRATGQLSQQDFRALGTPNLVYIRPVIDEDGNRQFYVHAADGEALGAAASYEQAVAEARVHELEPVSLH
ncbi:hypothetical protein CCR85_12120 [Rhodothalassium salexigens]|uniref:DUF1150 family protein n=1 Tax=Rhodothalassium salexigens TaxID=1086 RepID=UPI00191497AB|nr:DUF1150 family protein [Rhodothalassium salexigens]MBK5912235.1 hypothetical protein [Rhodothalassium salexigens]